MHGRACDEREKGRHMWTAPPRPTASVKAVGSSSSLSSPNSFFKDGRKITVGDCALFKPVRDSPPFIGIICSLTTGKENQLKLGVNWLYRLAEVKLGKGIHLDAAPNEIFYSFHKDEIPAVSLLHPCKVAFLPKGVELPSGICSFVCRRVYDITNKCLWWLTDKDYIDERQEEVDQLLYKTRLEMNATVQQGGRSPKPVNGPTSTSQLKPIADGVHNNGSFFPSQVKGKKRERMDQCSEPVKRERTSRFDDGDPGRGKLESTLKSEIAKITEKGGLVNSEGVEKLVQLMLPEGDEKKIDLESRSILAGVVAATDKFDCLSRFVQLRGLPVFDEWLQEVHKGKIGDSTSPKDGEKSTEELLLVLLRALDKLPINLHALQTCNIGKSVNHLRSHKNVEIQRKARSLVDMWKKRVEAEMDAKSSSNQCVSWPARSRLPEASHGTIKTSTAQSHGSKSSSAKLVQGENNTKSASTSPGSTKSAQSLALGGANLKDGQMKNADGPLTSARDEKSSSSSPSHNNSQSYSSDHAKTGGVSGKENKNSSGSSRRRKSANGFQGSAPLVVQRETVSSRSSSLQRNNNAGSEKLSQSRLTCEKAADVPAAEGNSHKLIVKIPNRGRSPAQNAGALEDVSMDSRASFHVLSEKNQVDHNLREKGDTNQANVISDVNTESRQSNDFKDVRTGSGEGGGSLADVVDEERYKAVDEDRKMAEVPESATPPSANGMKPDKQHDGFLSSINALVESCAKNTEVDAPMAIGDDVGMNLLASVAAEEISKSDMALPTGSPQANGNDVSQNQSIDGANNENEKQQFINGTMQSKDAENKSISKPLDDVAEPLDFCGKDLKQAVNQCPQSNGNLKEDVIAAVDAPSMSNIEKILGADGSREPKGIEVDGVLNADHVSDTKPMVNSSFMVDSKAVASGMKVESEDAERPSNPISEMDRCNKKEQKSADMTSELVRETNEAAVLPSGSGKDVASGNLDELKTVKTEKMDASNHCDSTKQQKTEGQFTATGKEVMTSVDSSMTNHQVDHAAENLDRTEVTEQESVGPSPSGLPSSFPVKEEHKEIEEAEEIASAHEDACLDSAAGGSNMDAKVGFDLNEGFSGEDGRNGDLNGSSGSGALTSMPVQLISPLPFPASITVAAAAKRLFVPPEDLLRNKGMLGWKGSAATSAFRPTEPRKALEVPNINSSAPFNSTPGKQSRPPLDIDLNVPGERVLEDLAPRSSGQIASSVSDPTGFASLRPGLDLDLNRIDEPIDISNNYACNNNYKLDVSFQSGNCITDEMGARTDFDLNSGPGTDDVNFGPSTMFGRHARPTLHSHPPLSGMRMNNTADLGNFSSWFPGAANAYSVVPAPPSILPGRGDHQPFPISGPQRMLGPTTTPSPFSADLYRGPLLSSSPAVPFPSNTPFQYPVFPFGTSFPLSSASFSASSATYVDSSSTGRLVFPCVNSQLLGSAVTMPSNYTRPCVVGLTDGKSNSASSESSGKWFRQDLDLNSGPETEASFHALRPLSASGSQTLTEEQARMFQMSSGVLKRKEPEGEWKGYKQS